MAAEGNILATLDRTMPIKADKLGRQHLVVEDGLRVLVRHLCIALMSVSIGILVLTGIAWRTFSQIGDIRPVVVRISATGEAVAAPYVSLESKPKVPEVKYFLERWTHGHYARLRATIQDDWNRQLYYLEKGKADQERSTEQRTKSIPAFLTGTDDEVDIKVGQILVEDLVKPPYKATVEFYKIYSAPNDMSAKEKKRERFTATVHFTMLDKVDNEILKVNPLGFVITSYHEDQAFNVE